MSEVVPNFSPSLPCRAYVCGIISGDFDDKTQEEVASILGVTTRSLRNWNRKIDWGYIRDERRERYARMMVAVDAAMLKAAAKGDVAAAKLVYERFDGWIPMQGILAKTDGAADEVLRARAAEITTALLAQSGAPQDQPGTGAPGAA